MSKNSVLAKARSRLRRVVVGPSARQRFDQQVAEGHVVFGRGTYGYPIVTAYSAAGSPPPYLIVGNYCSIAAGVSVLVNGGHRTEWATTFPIRTIYRLPGAGADGHPKPSGPVVVGSDVWIGAGATILGGVEIGHGAVIGAGAVVASDVRPYTIVAGNPARELGRRFTDEVVDALLETAWWELDEATVCGLADVLCDVPDFDRLRMRIAQVRSSQ